MLSASKQITLSLLFCFDIRLLGNADCASFISFLTTSDCWGEGIFTSSGSDQLCDHFRYNSSTRVVSEHREFYQSNAEQPRL